MLGLHKILNKILHHRISQASEYASSSKYANVTQGSVKNGPSQMFDRVLSALRVLDMLRLKYAKAANMSRLHRVLCKLYFKDSRYFEFLEF